VKLHRTPGDSGICRPLKSDDQSRLEQKLFVTFGLAPAQMNLLPALSSVLATTIGKSMGARIVEHMKSNRQGQKV
jgi:hypothetical protein